MLHFVFLLIVIFKNATTGLAQFNNGSYSSLTTFFFSNDVKRQSMAFFNFYYYLKYLLVFMTDKQATMHKKYKCFIRMEKSKAIFVSEKNVKRRRL